MKQKGKNPQQSQGRGPSVHRQGRASGARAGASHSADAGLAGHSYAAGTTLRGVHSRHPAQDRPTGYGGDDSLDTITARATELHAAHGGEISRSSAEAGVPESALAAVILTEADQVGATAHGANDLALRFEPYAFYERTGHWIVATHKDQQAEYTAFERARALDADAAHACARIGLGQVAGSEADAAGYPDAGAMMTAMRGDEAAQLQGLANVIQHTEPLAEALSSGDWAQVAELRAGPGYGAVSYDESLAAYASAYAAAASAAYGGDDDGDDSDENQKDKKSSDKRR